MFHNILRLSRTAVVHFIVDFDLTYLVLTRPRKLKRLELSTTLASACGRGNSHSSFVVWLVGVVGLLRRVGQGVCVGLLVVAVGGGREGVFVVFEADASSVPPLSQSRSDKLPPHSPVDDEWCRNRSLQRKNRGGVTSTARVEIAF